MSQNPSALTGPADTVLLRDGVELPVLGLGVFRSPAGQTTRDAVAAALKTGYRHVDTAAVYGNESDVGAALRASGLDRGELFLTTKLWNADQGRHEALDGFENSRRRLGVDYVDLYLVHWPVQGLRLETWKAMEELLESGRVRAIGVSNYMHWHLEELMEVAVHRPSVNQLELSPYNYRSRLRTVELCRELGIQLEAYSPLTKGLRLDDPPLVELARRHGRSTAQILIRWGLQHSLVELPKSTRPDRIESNADVFGFALDQAEMDLLDGLDENLATGWDPTGAP